MSRVVQNVQTTVRIASGTTPSAQRSVISANAVQGLSRTLHSLIMAALVCQCQVMVAPSRKQGSLYPWLKPLPSGCHNKNIICNLLQQLCFSSLVTLSISSIILVKSRRLMLSICIALFLGSLHSISLIPCFLLLTHLTLHMTFDLYSSIYSTTFTIFYSLGLSV